MSSISRKVCFIGRFPFTKKFGKFPLGKSAFHLPQVPFEGAELGATPGCLQDCERYGTGDEDNEDVRSVNGTRIFHWEVSTGKTGLPFQKISFVPENFQWNEPKTLERLFLQIHETETETCSWTVLAFRKTSRDYPGCQRVFFVAKARSKYNPGEREKKPLDAAVTGLTSMRF